jgi:phosphate transport system substrate-binding protein
MEPDRGLEATAARISLPRSRRCSGLPSCVLACIVLAPMVLAPAALATEPLHGRLVLAGCAANLPLTRLLARAFTETHPELTVVLESVGSTNGIWLAAAGVVHIGLASRVPWDEERALPVTWLPYARTAVVIAADSAVTEEGLTRAELLDIYRGLKRNWNGGHRIALLTRQTGDSATVALREAVPGFAAAYEMGQNLGRGSIFYDEESMLEALASLPFSIGLTDLGTLTIERLPIKLLALDGVAPTLDNLASGRYAVSKTLSFVVREDKLAPAARAFLRFVRSEAGHRILRTSGYLPMR